MKPEELKLYNIYNDKYSQRDYIYVGTDNTTSRPFCFFYKREESLSLDNDLLLSLNEYDSLKVKFKNNIKENCIVGYSQRWPRIEEIKNFKPSLKNKIKNILNR